MVEGYQKVAALSDVPDRGTLGVDVAGRSLVLVRSGGRVVALENRCPHAGAPLSEGFVDGRTLTCAWHGWSFDIDTGRCTDDPDTCVPAFDVRVEAGDVFVRL